MRPSESLVEDGRGSRKPKGLIPVFSKDGIDEQGASNASQILLSTRRQMFLHGDPVGKLRRLAFPSPES